MWNNHEHPICQKYQPSEIWKEISKDNISGNGFGKTLHCRNTAWTRGFHNNSHCLLFSEGMEKCSTIRTITIPIPKPPVCFWFISASEFTDATCMVFTTRKYVSPISYISNRKWTVIWKMRWSSRRHWSREEE